MGCFGDCCGGGDALPMDGIMKHWKHLFGAVCVSLLSSCAYFSQENAAPVIDLKHDNIHVISRGETLYEIAWRYGKDYRDIARINHIQSPYIIYPGQKLSINGTRRPKLSNIKTPKPPSPKQQQNALPNIHQGWDWPTKGTIIKRFALKGATPSKGIDISGTMGTPIRAASGGKVVYSGAGLRGYGQLIIIKHNDAYLSAYAHNRRLLVREGESINKGQVIAEMGQTDSDTVKLHFEIRKNGKPIDPLPILPRYSA
jgi:lipoprotein NlpD